MDQLPSVGPGNVFRELVQCGVIPVTVLDMVFRQAGDSRIAANARRMQEDNAGLDYGTDFTFIAAGSAAEQKRHRNCTRQAWKRLAGTRCRC